MALFGNKTPQQKGTVTTQPREHEYAEVEEQANIPYRGYVDHGVPVEQNFLPAEEDESQPAVEDLVTWDTHEETGPAPIPVYTVPGPGQSGTVHRMFHTWSIPVDVTSRMIANRHDSRSKIRIANNGTVDVYIGNDLTVSFMTGYPISAGTNVELNTNREVYAVTVDAGPAMLNVLEEYTVLD